jgi:hypothetical protein
VSRCHGLHCDGCDHGNGGPAAAVIALLVIIAIAARAEWPKIVHTIEIIAWTVAATAGAVIAVTGTVVTVRIVRRVRARRRARPQVTYHIAPVIPAVRVNDRPAIDRPGRQPQVWPLPGWWEEFRPGIGGDSDGHRCH